MVSIKSVFADVDDSFVNVHTVAAEFVEAGDGSKDGSSFVELDNSWLGSDALQSGVTAESERYHLVETVVTVAVTAVQLAKVGF